MRHPSRDFTSSDGTWRQHQLQAPPLVSAPCRDARARTICMKCFLAAASGLLQKQSLGGRKRGKRRSQSQIHKRRRRVVFLCFTSEELHRLKARRRRCRIPKKKKEKKTGGNWEREGEREGKEAEEETFLLVLEHGATRRRRACLCGGEHREEAQQKGSDIFQHTCIRGAERGGLVFSPLFCTRVRIKCLISLHNLW